MITLPRVARSAVCPLQPRRLGRPALRSRSAPQTPAEADVHSQVPATNATGDAYAPPQASLQTPCDRETRRGYVQPARRPDEIPCACAALDCSLARREDRALLFVVP